ncbi:1460_t:CDS:2 [Entrophospora sp. SA101]|nr:1460_t:CDS:2 [Entrophospora sp. SA101]
MGNYINQTNIDLVGSPLYVAPKLAKALKNRILMLTTDSDSGSDTAQCRSVEMYPRFFYIQIN